MLRVNDLFKDIKKKFLKDVYYLEEITFGEEKINYLVGDLRLKNIQ